MEVENPEELARGELKEEMGLHAAEMTYLGWLWIAYGFLRQKQHVFLATGLTEAEKDPDPEEHDLVVRSFAVEEFEEMMLNGTIRDNCTLSAWGFTDVEGRQGCERPKVPPDFNLRRKAVSGGVEFLDGANGQQNEDQQDSQLGDPKPGDAWVGAMEWSAGTFAKDCATRTKKLK
jgi:hypothetical protein